MPYIGKFPSKDEVAKKLLSMLREGKENEVDPAVMEEVDKILKEHEDGSYYVKMKDLKRAEHGFWECPVCHRIANHKADALDACPFCKYQLNENEIEAQKDRAKRTKMVY